MIYAETERLHLRALRKNDLPRFTSTANDWDIAKYLSRLPYPYKLEHAEWWYEQMTAAANSGKPEFFVLAHKDDDLVMGAIGLHPPAVPEPEPSILSLGYWLGKPYWGKGYMSEAVPAVIKLGFAREDLKKITVFTDPDNVASQNVLRKAGFRYLGLGAREEQNCLRGSETVTRWEMTRKDYEGRA